MIIINDYFEDNEKDDDLHVVDDDHAKDANDKKVIV